MSGGWSCIVRFACHIPMGMVGFGGRSLYSAVKDLADTGIYDAIPQGHSFLYGLKMYSTWGIFAFAWNFIMFLGCFACTSYLLALLGAIDLMIAASLFASAVKQAMFLPRTYAACGGAADWRNGTDGRNFFVEAEWDADVWETYGYSEDICYSMVNIWVIAVAMVILYALIGLINIALGLLEVRSDYNARRPRRDRRASHKTVRARARAYYDEFQKLMGGILLILLKPAIWLLDHPLAACRFSFRYICKVLNKRRRPTSGSTQEGEEKASSEGYVEKRVDVGEQLVLPYEFLRMVSQDLHFADLVSASRASRTLRMSLFGRDEQVPANLRDLQEVACRRSRKSSCGLCGIQICVDCRVRILLETSQASRHAKSCRPYCSKCFYKTKCSLASWSPPWGWSTRHWKDCTLAEAPRTDVEMGAVSSRGLATEMVCRLCAAATRAEQAAMAEARGKLELERRWRGPLACAGCQGPLSRGPRWWVCNRCCAECPSHLHSGWGEKESVVSYSA